MLPKRVSFFPNMLSLERCKNAHFFDQQTLENEYVLAKIGFDIAENDKSKISFSYFIIECFHVLKCKYVAGSLFRGLQQYASHLSECVVQVTHLKARLDCVGHFTTPNESCTSLFQMCCDIYHS